MCVITTHTEVRGQHLGSWLSLLCGPLGSVAGCLAWWQRYHPLNYLASHCFALFCLTVSFQLELEAEGTQVTLLGRVGCSFQDCLNLFHYCAFIFINYSLEIRNYGFILGTFTN